MRCLHGWVLVVSTIFLTSVLIAGNANAFQIGVSYAGDNAGGFSIQIGAAQTAGVVPQTNWNAATGESGNLVGLVDSDGNATTASVTWSCGNTWGGGAATTDDEAMVNGWLDDTETGNSTVVTDIPYATYDVYVYGSSDGGNQGGSWAITVNGVFYDSNGGVWETLSGNGTFFDGTNYVDAATGSNDPTYVRVQQQSGNLTIEGIRNGGVRGAVSGFQIVESLGGFKAPTAYTRFRGIPVGGVDPPLSDFVDSDDVRALWNPGFVINSSEAPVWLIFDGNCPSPPPGGGGPDILVESQAGTPGLEYTVEAFNYVTGVRDVVGTSDESFNADVVNNYPTTSDHVDANGDVQSRIGWRKVGLTINFPWEVRIDQVGWFVQ